VICSGTLRTPANRSRFTRGQRARGSIEESLLSWTPCLTGEILSLHWKDVNVERREPSIP